MGKNIQATLLNSTVWISILPYDFYYVASINKKVGTGVEVNLDSLFKRTSSSFVCELVDLMNADTEATFEAVPANAKRARKNQTNIFANLCKVTI